MQLNPMVDTEPEKEQEKQRYPFHIVCVYEDAENNDFPIIHEVRSYCAENHLTFVARQYDCNRYQEDIYINRLPAFHIFYKKVIMDTYYFDIDPVHRIQIDIWAYEDEMKAKERARIRRQEKWNAIKNMFTINLDRFKRKPALDLEASLSHTRVPQSKNSSLPSESSTLQTQTKPRQLSLPQKSPSRRYSQSAAAGVGL